jgi:hypothetical protein
MTTPTTVQVRMQLRADTAANWTSINPTLLSAEIGLERDTNKIKIGNGSTTWNSLGYFPFVVSGGVVTGNLEIGTTGTLTFEGSSADGFETTLAVVNPTADRTITLPNVTGTVITTGDTGTVTSTMIADGTIVNADVNASAAIAHSKLASMTAGFVLIGNASNVPTATALSGDVTVSSSGVTAIGSGVIVNADISATAEIAVSKLADGAARQLLQTDAAGTGVEWTDNIDVPGTLDVTGAATFDNNVTVQGDLTVNGTTTTIDTQNLLVEDKNVVIGNVTSPTNITADGGGITLKGSTDKTLNWVDATDAWTSSEHVNIASGKEYRIDGAKVLDGTSLGSGVVSSSLTSVGTIGTGIWQGTAISKTYLDSTLVSTGDTGTVTSTMIADGTIVNGDINASAAIAGTKISPDFGSQTITTTGVVSAALGAAATPSLTFTGDTNTGIFSPGADQVAISTGGSERARISGSHIYIVDAEPNSAGYGGGGNGGFRWRAPTQEANTQMEGYSTSTGTSRHILFSNPNGVVGAITTNASATTYATSSDYRLKENVTAVTDGITRLQQLKPSRFNFIADPDTVVDGFIAHEAAEVVPECVTGTKDEVDENGNPVYQGIDQSKLVPLLTAALQEAIGRIETLEAEVAALKAQ